MKLDSKRFRLILLGALAFMGVAFVVIAFLGLSTLSAKSKEVVDLKLQSKVANAELTHLQQAKKQIAQYGFFKDLAKQIIPADKDQAQAVLDISNFANQSGFLIASITFPNSTLDKEAKVPAATPQASTPAPSTSTAPTNAASAAPAAVISQAKPVPGSPGLYSIELTITPQAGPDIPPDRQVTYDKMIEFLKKIERNRRTAQITKVTIQPKLDEATNQQYFNFSLTNNIFMRPSK